MTRLRYDAAAASQVLAAADPALAEVIAAVGPPRIELRPGETLPALLRSVTYQQLSTKAAATIHGRVMDRLARDTELSSDPDALARAIASAPDDDLRGCGLSRAKTASARDLAARQLGGSLPSRSALLEMSDAEAVLALTAVRGVGEWTAQMMLIFNLGRPDVWPVADLGVQEGLRIVRGLGDRPTPKAMRGLGEPYAPWRSVAAWYCWRAVHRARGEE